MLGHRRRDHRSFSAARPTGRVVLIGLTASSPPLPALALVFGEREVLGSLSHLYNEDLPLAVDLIGRGEVRTQLLVRVAADLEEAVLCLTGQGGTLGTAVKVLVHPNAGGVTKTPAMTSGRVLSMTAPDAASKYVPDKNDEGARSPSTWATPADRPARLGPAVTEQLLRRIAFGEFPPGAYLPTEPLLALQFKVSRTVIRESVRALEDKGVLSAQQGRGTVVSERDQWSPFDPSIISARLESESSTKLFRDLAEIRMAIECQLAESAALNAEPATLAELERVVDEQDRLTISDPHYTELDVQFHQLIAEASGNEIGRGIMTTLAPACWRCGASLPDPRWHGAHSRVAQADFLVPNC